MYKLLKKSAEFATERIDTQEDMENAYSSDALHDEIAYRLDFKLEEISSLLEVLENDYPETNAEEAVTQFVALLMDPQLGENNLKTGMYSHESTFGNFMDAFEIAEKRYPKNQERLLLSHDTFRVVEMSDFLRILANISWIKTKALTLAEELAIATKLIVALEDVFAYVISVKYKYIDEVGTEQYRYRPYIVFDMKQDEWDTLNSSLNISHFPLIEKPKDWTQTQIGGYYESFRKKPTKQRGAKEQPQNVLDILNILQHNEFRLTQYASQAGYTKYVKEKIDKLDFEGEEDADSLRQKIVSNTTSSFDFMLKVMKPFSFFFEWQFDFRGRAYSTGYNINLQADKYKKGMIRPMPSNFPRKEYTIDTSNFKGV